jgi:ferritin
MKKSLLQKSDIDMLNEAVGLELTASSMYMQLMNCMRTAGYHGCAKHFKAEAEDERKHAELIMDFMNDMGAENIVTSIPAQKSIDDIVEAFETAYDAEEDLGEFYMKSFSGSKNEYVRQFLLGFIERQRLAIGEYGDFLATLEAGGKDKCAYLIFDAKFQ